MLRLFIALLFTLLTTTTSSAAPFMTLMAQQDAPAPSGCSCAGALVFCWEMTADFVTTDDIANSGGCSAGDATVALNSTATGEVAPAGRTGYSLYCPTGYDYGTFVVDTDDIFHDESGTITFDLYIHTWVNGGYLLQVQGAASTDLLEIKMDGTDELKLAVEGNNAGTIYAITTTANLAVDTWYSVTAKWRTTDTDPNLSLTVNGVTATSNTNCTAWTTAPTFIKFGVADGTAASVTLKNLKVYNAWQD